MSLSSFPSFKRLELDDHEEIQNITDQFPPYSDQDFISLWSWDTEEEIEVSRLNDNVIFLMLDYLTKEKFYSFIGNRDLEDTIDKILALSESQGYGNKLKLIPKDVVENLGNPEKYTITADRDNFDYVLHVPTLANLNTRKNKSRRKKINLFSLLYEDRTRVELGDITKLEVQEKLINLFETWARKKTLPKSEIDSERAAIKRLFMVAPYCQIETTMLYVEDKLVGFSTDEIAKNHFAVGHFMKANIDYAGSFQYLDHQVNLNLIKHKVEFINIEQDMGLEPLRISKLGLHPSMLLEKFTLARK